MENKTCYMCKKTLSVDCFKSHSKRGLQSHCVECQKEYRRQHYVRNRQKYLEKAAKWNKEFRGWYQGYKTQFICVKCGESHPACIDFHHPNDDKYMEVSRLVSAGCKQKVLEEIEKCIPVCRNCHAKIHWE